MSDNVNSSNSIPSDVFPVAPNPEILRRARKRESNRRDYQKHKERRRRNRPRVSELRAHEALLAEHEARLAEYEAQLVNREAQLINFIYANGLIPPEPPTVTMTFSSDMVSSSIAYGDLFSSNEVDLCESHASTLSSVASGDSLFETELYNLESNEVELSENHVQTFSSAISIDTFLDPDT
ncbi:16845_t:CDS:2 [Dentiscutata heterogama]|uniref:16845_t:CDS:1 n=1 Tax=Dentiscutata heterogama TaxID=1316150 RepID=A0ACA9KRH9_9GLOM|nr:16845_t:CDS:2 [Dentiscutata heterogama]